MSTELGHQLGWWDTDYFWNGEDLDFCYRIQQSGHKVMYYPEVIITHFKGASGGYKDSSHGKQSVSQQTKQLAARSSTQAMKIFYDKHYAPQSNQFINWTVYKGIALLESYRVSKIK